MTNQEITNIHYQQATQGLSEPILRDGGLWYDHVSRLPMHLQVVYTIVVFHNQVFNGGFHQYFLNGYGQFAYLTIDHLRRIGAHQAAELLERAVEEVNRDQLPLDEFRKRFFSRRIDRIANFDDTLADFLDTLDNQYYALEEDLEQLVVAYLKESADLNSPDHHCSVCGYPLDHLPWGEDGRSPTYEICPCCGVEFGNEDYTPASIQRYRAKWIQEGAIWFTPEAMPDDWKLEEQLANISP